MEQQAEVLNAVTIEVADISLEAKDVSLEVGDISLEVNVEAGEISLEGGDPCRKLREFLVRDKTVHVMLTYTY